MRSNLILSVVVLLLIFLPVGDWALVPLENAVRTQLPDHVDGIIIIGGDEDARVTQAHEMPAMLDSARRYVGFVKLAKEFPQARLFYSGGQGSLTPLRTMKEADIAKLQITELGIAPDRVIYEGNSRTTYENAALSAAIAGDDIKKNWVLVTSAYHMPRALLTFRQQGWNITGYPVGYFAEGTIGLRLAKGFTHNLYELQLALHEYIGLFWYWLMQYSGALWPN
ncbi:MAG: YdcF family protein [Alphaproteobacteria bacterium]|nr:YdcF family protein [Alphaproteobacteria bacterium]MBV8549429.1 YdcF family protein [Alphaproteobacteria bacterium]